MNKFNIGDIVSVSAQAMSDRYAFVPNLAGLIRFNNYNLNATVTQVRHKDQKIEAWMYVVAFEVAPDIQNLVFDEDEIELVSPVFVRKLDEAIAEAEAHVETLKKYRALILKGT